MTAGWIVELRFPVEA